MKIEIFNREICACALLDTNSFMRRHSRLSQKQRRNEEKYEKMRCADAGIRSLVTLRYWQLFKRGI